jgi:hypothetical protein
MTGLSSLDGVHRERAHGIDGDPGGIEVRHGRVRAHRTGARDLDCQDALLRVGVRDAER